MWVFTFSWSDCMTELYGCYTHCCTSLNFLHTYWQLFQSEISHLDTSHSLIFESSSFGIPQPFIPVPQSDHSSEIISDDASVKSRWINRRARYITQVWHLDFLHLCLKDFLKHTEQPRANSRKPIYRRHLVFESQYLSLTVKSIKSSKVSKAAVSSICRIHLHP